MIVLANVDADTNAAFYVAWGVVAVTCWVPYTIGQALLAEGGKDGAAIHRPGPHGAGAGDSAIMTAGAVAATSGAVPIDDRLRRAVRTTRRGSSRR